MARSSPSQGRAPRSKLAGLLPGVAFFAALVLSFTGWGRAQAPAGAVLAWLRQVRSVLLEQHVPPPDPGRVEAGAWAGLARVSGEPAGRGPWSAFEQGLASLGGRRPDMLGRAGQAALEGMVEAVGDPYTAVLDPEDMGREARARSTGEFAGVGVELAWQGGLVVVSTLPGSPAAVAGLRTGDRIRAVDGRPTAGLTFYRAGALLSGPPGSRVRLDLVRNGTGLQRTLERQTLKLPGVEGRLLPSGVALLRIGYFGPDTAERARAALAPLRSRASGLVLDLRGNPGGDFDQGVAVAALLCSGVLLQVETREGVRPLRAPGPPAWPGPLAVLVDRGTASAAEIVAQAVQGTPGATVVGERTFGKAAIQTLYTLPGGYGLRVTTGRYLGRDGESLHGRGLAPDLAVPPGQDPLAPALRLLSPRRGARPGGARPTAASPGSAA